MPFAKLLLPLDAVVLAFAAEATVHDMEKAWRCRPDDRATEYERADQCGPEGWR